MLQLVPALTVLSIEKLPRLVLLVCRFTLQLQSLERIEAEQKAMIEKLTNS
jgi:hypothetical protein